MHNMIKTVAKIENLPSTYIAKVKVYCSGLVVGKGTEIYGRGCIEIGKDCYIGRDSFLKCRDNAHLRLGNDFSCTSNMFISCLGEKNDWG